MDEIPLPDDIPTPKDEASSPSMLIIEQPENVEITDFVANVEIESTVVCETTDNKDDSVADMDIQANTPEMEIPPEYTFGPINQPQNEDTDVVLGHNRAAVAVSEESEVVSSSENNQTEEVSVSVQKNVVPPPPTPPPEPSSQDEQAVASVVADPVVQNTQTSVVGPMIQNSQATVVDSMMQNAQMQYSAANYMYPQHMADPSMMSNYSYMTGNYNDYMSMYNPMQQQQYANTYASYQNYNYAYPAMQQMYDGRNVAQYAGNYSAQMLPATPPLPSAQSANKFNPPLPTATSFLKASATTKTKVDSKPPLQVKNETKKKVDNVANKTVVGDDDDSANLDMKDSTDVEKDEGEQESEKTDDGTDMAQPSSVSEDVNRYSPSLPMDEDEANSQMADAESKANSKPSSVLGKAQAKKRLMAFSFSKQAAAAKKQAQEMAASTPTPKNRKENGEVGQDGAPYNSESNVFEDKHSKKKQRKVVQKEKARETIEEIEELKRTEMAGTNAILYRQSMLSELNNQHQDSNKRGGSRRSRSNSRGRRRYTRSRSRDRKSRRSGRKYRYASHSRSRSRSKSRSRSSSVQDRKPTMKTTDIKSWDDFMESGFQLDRYRRIKFKETGNSLESEVERRKKEMKRRSRSKDRNSASIEKEVVEDYRGRKVNFLQLPMEIKQPLLAVRYSRDSAYTRTTHELQEETKEYPSHMIQYTSTKPVLKYCENPKRATLHFITRTQLLETVPDDIALLIKQFWSTLRPKKLKQKEEMDGKNSEEEISANSSESKKSGSIEWFSKSPLFETFPPSEDEVEYDDHDPIHSLLSSTPPTESAPVDEVPAKPVERTRTRKSRFEEATDANQSGVSLVVRSRWDSDYEDESPSKSRSNKVAEADDSKTDTISELNNESFTRIYEGPIQPPPKKESVPETVVDETVDKSRESPEKSVVKKYKEKKKRDDKRSKSRFESPEPEIGAPTPNDEDEYSEKSATDSIPTRSGDHKLVSEYEEFLKMVNFEPPKEGDDLPMYEGPKPPPRWNKKTNEEANKNENSPIVELAPEKEDRNPFIGSDDEKDRMEVDEDDFDIDTFFMKEKEKKMRKLSAARLVTETRDDVPEKEEDEIADDAAAAVAVADVTEEPVEMSVKKHEKKDKKKKKSASFKTKKRDAKDRRKRKTEKKKKKKASESSSDSSDSESENDSKRESESNSSSSSSSNSTSSTSSSDDNSSDSSPKKKRKRTKKTKKKDKKREKSVADKRKKKKDRKKKSKNDDSSKRSNKSKKKSSENFLDLINKSLAVTLKKSENEKESPASKKEGKEKRKKRKKKHEREKKEKTKSSDLSESIKAITVGIEDADQQKQSTSDESSNDMRKKKKKLNKKKRENVEASSEEPTASGWKRKKIDLGELEENMNKARMNTFLESKRKIENVASTTEVKRKKKDSGGDVSTEEIDWKKKKIDPKEIEETAVAKVGTNSFFEENLDDWDTKSTAAPVVVNSMRDDDSKNEKRADVKMKKKKKKHKNEKRKSEKSKSDKSKTDKERKKDKSSRKKKKTKKRKKRDNDDNGDGGDDDDDCSKEKKKGVNHKNIAMDIEDIPLPECGTLVVPLERESAAPQTPTTKDSRDQWESSPCKKESDRVSEESTRDDESGMNVSDRYSPTACDAEEEEEENPLPARGPRSPPEEPSTTPSENMFELYSHYLASGVAQNVFSVVPSPVPAPSPVPPPTIPTNFSVVAEKPSATLKTAAAEPVPVVPEEKGEERGGGGEEESSPQSVEKADEPSLGSCKSFSIGKKEFRTKAALKFFSNSAFDSDETVPEEPENNIPEETRCKNEVDERLTPPSPPLPPPRDDDDNDRGRQRRSDSRDRSKRERSTERYRSSSRDRNRRRHRYDRENSYDKYRRRSRSHDRYNKKYSYRRRSRSRNRRRSRDRDYYRHRRRSFSGDREVDRGKRTPPPPPPPYENSRKGNDVEDDEHHHDVEYDQPRRDDEHRYDEESRAKNTLDVIHEITRSVREMSGNATIKGNNQDINALQENLIQLKETLQNLNKQGVPLDSLRNVLSVLENSKLARSQSEFEDENRERIMSVCQAIHNNLPVTPEKKFDPYNNVRSPPEPTDARTKKSFADSTNGSNGGGGGAGGGFNKSRNRFETRSREISPKPLSLDERLELELGVKRAAMPPQNTQLSMNPTPYYPGVPMFDGRTGFPATLPIPNYPPPTINCANPNEPPRAYYRAPGPGQAPPVLNWNNIASMPPPMLIQRIPPPCVVPSQSADVAGVTQAKQSYRVPDPAGNKVHSIQVGNVLQIVPTEVQAPVSSQSKIPSSQVPVVSSSPSMPLPSSQAISSVPMSTAANAVGFSTFLSAHLPSFATAPAVSGAKSSVPTLRPNNETPKKEQKLVPNDPRQKIKDQQQSQPPLASFITPPASACRSKIVNLPLPPGISEIEMKKLMRLAKEKRKEEKALQNMLKGRGVRASPVTPTSDDNSFLDDVALDEHGDHINTVHIKPSPEQGILISPGFKEKSTPVTALGRSIIGSTRKAVSFVDGIRPGSANDSPPAKTRRPSPPPLSPLSTAPKKKHKVRVKIIRPDDSDDDDEAPPPPPPGPPPPELYPPNLGALGALPPGFVLPKL